MSNFADDKQKTILTPAVQAVRRSNDRPLAKRLLRLLKPFKNVLLSTHQHPDPDALASCMALKALLKVHLPDAKITISAKGRIGGGYNETFNRYAETPTPWDQIDLPGFDAILVLDVQPQFGSSSLPREFKPLGVIDHHRSRKPKVPYLDIRTDVGATTSIIFSYFMELQTPIARDLAAIMLFAIESDLAGAAGTPGELDNLALSTLTLLADTRILYQMRYTDLSIGVYQSFYDGLKNAVSYGSVILTHLGEVESLERPALMGDLLLRYDKAQWAMVTATYEDRVIVSLRTRTPSPLTAGDLASKLLKHLGEGGGHRTKAGGFVPIDPGKPNDALRIRNLLRRRYLRTLDAATAKPCKLVQV